MSVYAPHGLSLIASKVRILVCKENLFMVNSQHAIPSHCYTSPIDLNEHIWSISLLWAAIDQCRAQGKYGHVQVMLWRKPCPLWHDPDEFVQQQNICETRGIYLYIRAHPSGVSDNKQNPFTKSFSLEWYIYAIVTFTYVLLKHCTK